MRFVELLLLLPRVPEAARAQHVGTCLCARPASTLHMFTCSNAILFWRSGIVVGAVALAALAAALFTWAALVRPRAHAYAHAWLARVRSSNTELESGLESYERVGAL